MLLTSVLFALAGCGGDSPTVTTSPGPFSVGGTVTGLAAGNTFALSNNGTDLLTLNANGAFVFLAKLASAGTFRVTVASATQNCSVTAGAGTIRYIDVTNVTVTCGPRTFTAAAPLAQARYSHTATLLPDGKVLVSGGVNDASGKATVASAELYDPSANSWSVVGSMAQPRNRHRASVLSNLQGLPNGKAPASDQRQQLAQCVVFNAQCAQLVVRQLRVFTGGAVAPTGV